MRKKLVSVDGTVAGFAVGSSFEWTEDASKLYDVQELRSSVAWILSDN